MAKYKAYTEYKDSGVEWLGDIPTHWQLIPCRAAVSHVVDKNNDGKIQNYLSLMANVGVIRYEDKGDVGNKKPDDLTKCKIVKKGQLVINSMNYGIGSYGMSPFDGICSPVYIILEPRGNVLKRYALRIFENTPFQKHLATFGNGILEHRSAIKWDDIKGQVIPLPSKDEQKTILKFLDHETAKIDNLIEKQQHLIELLNEKRQAVISHAVTKGLNPDVPMKDSEVEWLGEVPEHWIIKRLKHISPKVGVGLVINPSTYTKDEGVYFIFGGDVKEFGFDLTKTRRISPQDSNKLLPSRLNSRDLVSVRVGYPGITSVVTDDLEGSNCASIIIIRRGSYNSDWLCAAMNVWVGRQQVDLASYGAAQKQFNVSDAIEFIFPVPSINEQNDIADFVQKTLSKFDDLTQKALKQIELLQERRTALISAAVTGKIDVRDWVAPDTQKAEKPEETAV